MPAKPRPQPLRPAGVLFIILLAGVLDTLACRTGGPYRVPPTPARASIAFAEAQSLLIAGEDGEARNALEEALRLDPEWAAPGRALDDLDRAALLGPDLLERRRRELEEHPRSAARLYLVGRLEGAAGVPRFERGLDVDPEMAWSHHGVAWNLHAAGATRAALRHGRHALERSRDTWERSYFAKVLARYELALGRPERAAGLLEGRLAESDVLATDRVSMLAWLSQAEMMSAQPARSELGYRRGLDLLASEPVADEDIGRLVQALLDAPLSVRGERGALEIAASLALFDGDLRRTLRAGILLESGSPALALALLGDHRVSARSRGRLIAVKFARGAGRAALESWLAELPSFLRDVNGLPRDPRLALLVLAGRDGDDRELAAALLRAGWFEEARAFAEDLAAHDLEAAAALESKASAGVVLFHGIGRILDLVDRGRAYGGPWARASTFGAVEDVGLRLQPSPRPIESLDTLLESLQPLFETYHRAQGEDSQAANLLSSPRSTYGPAAEVVHPGPVFSAADEELELGMAGSPVGGLAAELNALGRFGIFGEAMGGGGPDGALLRVVLTEQRSGQHLGVPWSGLIAWCEGTDVESRPGRRGARISGAALHEGYWVDLAAVREELILWHRLEDRFLGPDAIADPAAALAVRGVSLEQGQTPDALVPLLGQADRVRLAVLVERNAAREAGRREGEELVTLDELAILTGIHEEGHLCDRTRFLPLGKNLIAGLGLLAAGGFNPNGVARQLEARAQLVSLCDAPDTRFPLSEILAAAELGGSVTPHAAAYRELLVDWLDRLAEEVDQFEVLDPKRALVHQLHHLTSDDIRQVSRLLARRKGLMR